MESISLDQLQKSQKDISNELSIQQEFENAIIATVDLNTWTSGENLTRLYTRLEQEVRNAVLDEEKIRIQIRNEVFPRIASGKKSTLSSGFHKFSVGMIEKAHKGLVVSDEFQDNGP